MKIDKNSLIGIASIFLASATLTYASCTVYINPNPPCANPPLGGSQTGYGADSCGDNLSNPNCTVTSIPTKVYAQWVNAPGMSSYGSSTIQCQADGGTYSVLTPCNGGTYQDIDFTVYGASESSTWPSGMPCEK